MVQLLRRSALLGEGPEADKEVEVVEKPAPTFEAPAVIKEREPEAEGVLRQTMLMNQRIKGLQRRQGFLVAALILVSILGLAMGGYNCQTASARAEAASSAQFTGDP